MKNNNQEQPMSRTQRYDAKQRGSIPQSPQQPVSQGFTKQKKPHGFLSFLVGLIFVLALIVRLTVLSGTFMEGAIQTPTVISRVHAEIASQLQAKNLPTSLATDDLIKATLKTGTRETYAGESLDFNTAAMRSAVRDDVNQQASSIGLAGTAASDAVVNLISSQVLTQASANCHDDTLEYFAEHVKGYQLWTTIIIIISGILWVLLLVSNHRRRRARRLSRKHVA
ncbi:hypothetical protein LROSL1_2162 [Furfurilactobacillus rossiae]|uniref:hypothetical protein n=1 Tax=Furfurilactobacillus rossiae TaxID=231049 RepID=UPI0015C01619|nr:hypothetical protein [Furfurilactobacillus rossiae]MCF6164674.1 hypothetical protein [Furfurilactobacillus rossiae]QLE64963.1 hypothetical protein LROSL1_2162 [Furfurilactobacillus rossiae]